MRVTSCNCAVFASNAPAAGVALLWYCSVFKPSVEAILPETSLTDSGLAIDVESPQILLQLRQFSIVRKLLDLFDLRFK